MAEADPDSTDTSEFADLKHIFRIPAFFKPTPDSDAGKSPTSPLDFGVFANFGGLFSPRASSPKFGHRNKWVSDKVGLSVLTSTIGHNDSFTRDNIVLAPQIKLNVDYTTTPLLSTQLFDPCVKSISLPKNYAAASFPDPVNIHPHPSDVIVDEHTSPRRSSSSPMDIISSQAYSPSLSGREMALSEDYTCIISHGPNPKTTHIFGDCILDCDPKELEGLGSKEEVEKPQGESLPNISDDSSSRLCLCTGKPQDCQNSHIDREVSAEKEIVEYSLEISPGSSYNENEDLFPMAMPINP
ncbi:FCS-Like Zinc finger 10 [Cardamine amara subsp. amara]|uniref:FCS-Like Zinc finger 10 n=1 Tax=Cardamine amara subsp. amara TaxID=228776 RepID=A0ABD0ZXL5_CARAN